MALGSQTKREKYMKLKQGRLLRYIRRLQGRIALNRRSFIVYLILRGLVILTGVRCLFMHNYESFFMCLLALVLFLIPSFFEEKFKLKIPPLFEIIIYCFIYAAEILGEVNQYYTNIPGWDTMLHTLNGFLCAALGFSMVELMNRGSRHSVLSPLYLAVMGFCFSMTVGVMWEFFEFAVDHFLYQDMQKDFIVQAFNSCRLDATGAQIPIRMQGIEATVLELSDGSTYRIEGGYLDLGIIDTMKDLFVNFVGALVFSVIGYFYEACYEKNNDLKDRRMAIVGELMWKPLDKDEITMRENQIDEQLKNKGKRRRS